MKQFLFAICVALASQFVYAVDVKETKKVCVDSKEVKDKNGKVKQNCKEIKQHKKLEVTK